MRLTVRRIFLWRENKCPNMGVWRNWLGGTVDGLPFAAKICDVSSPDGIDNGRVLKLFLYAEDGEQEIAAYERGWSTYPSGEVEASMEALIAYCASLPPAESW